MAETIGKSVFNLVVDEGSGKRVMEEWMNRRGDEIMKVKCEMVGNDGQRRPVEIVLQSRTTKDRIFDCGRTTRENRIILPKSPLACKLESIALFSVISPIFSGSGQNSEANLPNL